MGVDSATLMSAWGRIVRVGLAEGDASAAIGVIEDRRRGHSSMALDRVFRRMGRYVSRVYCWDSGTCEGVGAGYIADGLTAMNGGLDGDGRKCWGMWALSVGSKWCNAVISSVVEYLPAQLLA